MSQIVIESFPLLWTALSFSLVHAHAHPHSLLVKDACNPPRSYDSSSTSTLFFAPTSLPCTELFCCLRLGLPRGELWPPSCCFLPRSLHVPSPRRHGGGSCPGGVQGPGCLRCWLQPWFCAIIRTNGSVLRPSNGDSHFFPSPSQLARPVSAKPESSFQKEALVSVQSKICCMCGLRPFV